MVYISMIFLILLYAQNFVCFFPLCWSQNCQQRVIKIFCIQVKSDSESDDQSVIYVTLSHRIFGKLLSSNLCGVDTWYLRRLA